MMAELIFLELGNFDELVCVWYWRLRWRVEMVIIFCLVRYEGCND